MNQNNVVLEQTKSTQKNDNKQKQPLWKLIVLITSLALIGVLIVLIIVFACVKVDLTPKLNFNATGGIVFLKDDELKNDNWPINSDEYLQVVSKFKKGFKTSFLNSFTQGINKNDAYFISDQTGSINSLVNSSNTLYAFALDFNGNKETIYKPNGKEYKTSSGTDAVYTQFVVVLSEDNKGFSSIDIWFLNGASSTSSICLTGYGNFNGLFKYLDKLKEVR